jgi:hypothetical protein
MNLIRLFLLLGLALVTNAALSQKLSETDSLLRKKYYQKIYPKAINSRSDVLYDGIDNVIEIQYPDEVSKGFKYVFKTHNGILFEQDNSYITIPRNAGRAFISTYYVSERKDTILFGKKEFEVRNVPIPTLKIGNEIIKELSIVDRAAFIKNDSLKVYFTADIISSESWCSVEYFSIGYTYGGRYISIDNKGAILSKRTKDFIRRLQPNQNMVIKVSEVNCNKIIKNLPLVKFIIR